MTALCLRHLSILTFYAIIIIADPVSSLCRGGTRRHRNCDLLPGVDQCGVVSVNERVVGGHDATLGQFPWMAILYYQRPDENGGQQVQPFCGGTIINDRYVISAAHCVSDIVRLRIRLGEHNLSSMVDCKEGGICAPEAQDFEVESVTPHPRYNRQTLAYDLCLIRLKQKANLNQYVRPICLPTDKIFRRESTLRGKLFDIAGWGISSQEDDENTMPEVLQTTTVPFVPKRQCERIYGQIMSPTLICAGGEVGQSTCPGDSGGPLMGQFTPRNTRNRYFLIGAVSFGSVSCGVYPSGFANVPQLAGWVLDNITQ